MTRPVKQLFDLEIDEVSVVDRPANQHGLITFAKSAGLAEAGYQEDTVGDDEIYDVDGAEVDPDVLEHGDVVYDSEGNEYVFVEDDADEQTDEADDEPEGDADEYEEDEAEVGKGWLGIGARQLGKDAKQAGAAVGQGLKFGVKRGNPTAAGTDAFGRANRFGAKVWGQRSNLQRAAIAGAPVAAGGTAVGYETAKKSLGDEILEELSKAVNDTDRDQIIAKALDEVEVYKAQANQMAEAMAQLEDERVTEAFISKAAEYNLPVSPEVLGPILKAVAEVLTEEELDVLDALFESVGDTLYDEVGYVGDTSNYSVLDQVNAYAGELVGKADLTSAEAVVKAFEDNPAAYEAYLAEQNGR